MKITRAWLVDAVERVASTFGEAFLASFGLQGLIALSSGHIDFTAVHVAEQAGLAAVFALVKAALAAKAKRTVSPASLAPLAAAAPPWRHSKTAGHVDVVAVLLVILVVVLILFLVGAIR